MGISPLRAGFFAVFGLCLPASAAVTVGSDQPFGSGNYRSTQVHATVDLSETYLPPSYSNTGRITPAAPVAALGAPRRRVAGQAGQPSAEGRRAPAVRSAGFVLLPGQDETFGWGLTRSRVALTAPCIPRVRRRAWVSGRRPRTAGGDFSIGQTDFGVFRDREFRYLAERRLDQKPLRQDLDLGDARVSIGPVRDRAGLRSGLGPERTWRTPRGSSLFLGSNDLPAGPSPTASGSGAPWKRAGSP